MNAPAKPADFAIESFVRQQEQSSLLRLIACGSVDHGKSTLIGRLLYESNLLLEDQLDALKKASRRSGTQGEELDFSLVLDGLAAEIEQKITIDVAYRFFSSGKRKFIVADAPGHEQYTRNMATGASTADLAIILVSAGQGITRQTRRHSLIVSTLGVRHLVLAVNKMDLVDWSEEAFRAIETEYRAFAETLGVKHVTCIPMAAKSGDNVVQRSQRMGWYAGPTLAEHLDRVEIAPRGEGEGFRLPVQWVNRPSEDFRGYSGLVTGGPIHPGMDVTVLPSGRTSRIARIVGYRADLHEALPGQSVTVTLTDDIDVSRGDMIVAGHAAPAVSDRLSTRIVWMGEEALRPGRQYLLKLATRTAMAAAAPNLRAIDLNNGGSVSADVLAMNEIGSATLMLDRTVAAERYADSRETGGFILIDPETNDTVGMGFVEEVLAKKRKTQVEPWWRAFANPAKRELLHQPMERKRRSFAKAVSWRMGGTLLTFIAAYVITGSAAMAGTIAMVEVIAKTLFYYLHERGWSRVHWGRR